MNRKRAHPLFSGIGCGTTILLALVLGTILYFRGGGPFSPGQLTALQNHEQPLEGFESHAAFEQQCLLCHEPWRGITADRCESCHVDVADQRVENNGLHGRLANTAQCRACHTDHIGLEAKITHLDMNEFDHDRLTNYDLIQHQTNFDQTPIQCDDCHLDGNYVSENTDCVSCHADGQPLFMPEHAQLFGEDCLSCHDGEGRLVDFTHDDLFVLAGVHETAVCESCHINQQFAGVSDLCQDCHEEPEVHAGAFGLDCVRCHTETAWTPAQLTRHTFPLDHGDEGKIACETCHVATYVEYTCYNCHEHDIEETRQKHIEEEIIEFDDCTECHPTGEEYEGEDSDD